MKTRYPGNFSLSPITSLIAACDGGSSSEKQSQVVEMRLMRLASCIILSICISGCYSFSISQNDYKTETRKDLAESLIGESRANVIEKVGRPNQLLTDGKQQYMLYEHQSSAKELGMLFYLPVFYLDSNDTKTLHCLKIDLDANHLVVDYEFDSTAHFKGRGNYKCHSKFWNEEVWHSLEKLPVPPLKSYSIPNPDQQPQEASVKGQKT
jgi:hypothetical protein